MSNRVQSLYCLLLAYQFTPPDVLASPFTARRLSLARGELAALQQGDETRAAPFRAALDRHELALPVSLRISTP